VGASYSIDAEVTTNHTDAGFLSLVTFRKAHLSFPIPGWHRNIRESRVIRQLDKEQLNFPLARKPTAIGKTARTWTLRIDRPNESGSKIEYSKLLIG
jgi:hypothetical protein